MTGYRARLLVTAGTLLSSCAVTPPVVPSAAPVPPMPATFTVEGRFAARHGEKGVSGRFLWQSAPTNEEWIWAAPTGTPLAQLTVTPTASELVTADGEHFAADTPEALLAHFLPGELPPWSLLRQALWGLVPQEMDSGAVSITEERWHIAGWSWQVRRRDRFGRPLRLEVHRGETSLTLVIEHRSQ